MTTNSRAPITDDEPEQWARLRADDAGHLARELITYRHGDTADPHLKALKAIAAPRECGCSPVCQCNTEEALKIEVDYLKDLARSALETSKPVAEAVKVRPLEFEDSSSDEYTCFSAKTPLGNFAYGRDNQGKPWHISPIGNGEHFTEEAARIAVETAYRQVVSNKLEELGVLSAISNKGSVTMDAETVLAIRDALIGDSVEEAYHLLYRAVDPDFVQLKPWAEIEAAASYAAPEGE